jgi:hypothetical protein
LLLLLPLLVMAGELHVCLVLQPTPRAFHLLAGLCALLLYKQQQNKCRLPCMPAAPAAP